MIYDLFINTEVFLVFSVSFDVCKKDPSGYLKCDWHTLDTIKSLLSTLTKKIFLKEAIAMLQVNIIALARLDPKP